MAIPKAVRQQSERVEAMMRQTPQEQPTEGADQVDEAEAQAQAQEAQPEPQNDDLAQLKAELERSEQRYRTLQGLIRQKDDTLRQMETLLSQMQEQQNTQKQEAQNNEQRSAPPADEQNDRHEFGDDLVDMVNRCLDRRMATIENRLVNIENSTKNSEAAITESRTDRFYRSLTERVPDWQEIDNSPEFREWLQQSPARIDLVRRGMANFDVNGIAELFEYFKAVTGKGQTQQAAPAKPSLERKVAPSKGRPGNTAATTPEKRMWTRSEISQVYRDRRRFSQKEFDELQRDIFAAQREGRVDFSK